MVYGAAPGTVAGAGEVGGAQLVASGPAEYRINPHRLREVGNGLAVLASLGVRLAARREDAVKYAEEALALYLDTLIAHGDRIPEDMHSTKPVSLGITVRTPIIA